MNKEKPKNAAEYAAILQTVFIRLKNFIQDAPGDTVSKADVLAYLEQVPKDEKREDAVRRAVLTSIDSNPDGILAGNLWLKCRQYLGDITLQETERVAVELEKEKLIERDQSSGVTLYRIIAEEVAG